MTAYKAACLAATLAWIKADPCDYHKTIPLFQRALELAPSKTAAAKRLRILDSRRKFAEECRS